jgi:hypothetical protein
MEEFEIKMLEYLDGLMNERDRTAFEQYINSNPEAQERLSSLKAADTILKSEVLQQPSKNFTANVLANLHQTPLTAPSILNSIYLFAGIITVVGICITLLATGAFDKLQTTIDLNNVNLATKYIRKSLPAVSIDGKLLVNTIVVLNLFLALMILDRGILKPLFQRKAEARGLRPYY